MLRKILACIILTSICCELEVQQSGLLNNGKRIVKANQVVTIRGEQIEVFGHGQTWIQEGNHRVDKGVLKETEIACESKDITCRSNNRVNKKGLNEITTKLKDTSQVNDKEAFNKANQEIKSRDGCKIFPTDTKNEQFTKRHVMKRILYQENTPIIAYLVDFLFECDGKINNAFFKINADEKAKKMKNIGHTGLISLKECSANGIEVNLYGNAYPGDRRYGEDLWAGRKLCMTKEKTNSMCDASHDAVNVYSGSKNNAKFPPNQCFRTIFSEKCTSKTKSEESKQVHDALFLAEEFKDMLKRDFSDSTLEENCNTLKLCVMQKGLGDQAYFFDTGSCETYYGEGNKAGNIRGMASPSVVGHELCHVLISFTSRLENKGQSGAIAEAFADLCGIVLKAKLNNYVPDWTFGKELYKKETTEQKRNPKIIRSMKNPRIDHIDDYERRNTHAASGIYSKAIYKLANMRSWNLKKVFELFFHANKYYWRETTTFKQGLCDLVKSAEDTGRNQVAINKIEKAFASVGIFCGCPNKWTEIENGCVKVFKRKVTWTNAKSLCEMMDGQLLSIKNKAKEARLKNILNDIKDNINEKEVWMGAYRKNRGKWKWISTGNPKLVDGQLLKDKNLKKQKGKECALVKNSGKEWSAEDCSKELGFICELTS